jgi:hypothetical protein
MMSFAFGSKHWCVHWTHEPMLEVTSSDIPLILGGELSMALLN